MEYVRIYMTVNYCNYTFLHIDFSTSIPTSLPTVASPANFEIHLLEHL